MTPKGYTASVVYSEEDGCLVGRVTGIRDIVSFHGDTVADTRAAFVEAVDDYLDFSARLGQEPERPASGRLALRLPSDLHRSVRAAAARAGKSVNAFIVEHLERDVSVGV